MNQESNKYYLAELFLRVWLGAALISHSIFKLFNPEIMLQMSLTVEKLGFPFQLIFAYLAKGSEFFGGILLILGLFTRFASFFIFITMFVAFYSAHKLEIFGDGELAFTYFIISIYFLINGSKKYSIDNHFKMKELHEL
ncbi:MAG: DoxX family protein [Bacteroidetes bacterium]|nr:DoxX family protein [Bacteroidota bacterium]